MNEFGKVVGDGAVRIERVLPGPIERVWAYLTESKKRATWLAAGEMDLRVGGRVELEFRHADLSPTVEPTPERFKKYENGVTQTGHITRCEPPHLLSYTWGEESGEPSEVTFELSPRENDVLLVVTHRRLGKRPMMVSVAAGWHTHLGILIEQLNGREPGPFWSTYEQMASDYEKKFN